MSNGTDSVRDRKWKIASVCGLLAVVVMITAVALPTMGAIEFFCMVLTLCITLGGWPILGYVIGTVIEGRSWGCGLSFALGFAFLGFVCVLVLGGTDFGTITHNLPRGCWVIFFVTPYIMSVALCLVHYRRNILARLRRML